MQNGALQDYPLDEDDLENFHMRNSSRVVVVSLGSQGLPGSPKELPGAPKGLPRAPWGGVGLPGARIMCVHNGHFVCMCSFFCYCKLSFLKICVSSNNFLLCKGGF